MKILGYITLYIRVESKEMEPSYFKIHADFSKPITRRALRGILKDAKKVAVRIGLAPTKICFVTEEEFKNSETEMVWEESWKEG